jgi:hypothetical protein
MSDQWWKSMRARVSGWLAHPPGPLPVGRDELRPGIRFGPASAVTSSAADWLTAARGQSPRVSSAHPADRETEYDRLHDEIVRLAHPDDSVA